MSVKPAGQQLTVILMQQSILQIIFNLRPLEIQRSTQICTYRYWGIQACGALHQTRVAIELARGQKRTQ